MLGPWKATTLRLYGLYTPTHEVLAREWFLPTLQDNYEVRLSQVEQVGSPEQHQFGTGEFNRTTLRKVGLTLSAIEENWDDVFVMSDVDIQFFRPTERILREAVKDRDIVFQQNQANGEINAGFFVCRGNARTRLLWTAVQDTLRERTDWNDQDALNHLIFRWLPRPFGLLPFNHWAQYHLCGFAERGLPAHRVAHLLPLFRNKFGLRWRYLPREFFLKGLSSRGNWEPGEKMRLPKDIVMHHANFCLGVDAKIEQLRAVSASVAGRPANSATIQQPLR